MLFDHVNLRCSNLDATCSFLQNVAGLEVGARPLFPFPGYRLYHAGQAIVHLVGAEDAGQCAGPLGHIANLGKSAVEASQEISSIFGGRPITIAPLQQHG